MLFPLLHVEIRNRSGQRFAAGNLPVFCFVVRSFVVSVVFENAKIQVAKIVCQHSDNGAFPSVNSHRLRAAPPVS